MYRLFTASRLDLLLEHHGDALYPDFLDTGSLFVVQSSHMQRWLRQQWALRHGISPVPRMLLPDAAQRTLLADYRRNAPHPGDPGQGKSSDAESAERLAGIYLDDLKYLGYQALRMVFDYLAHPDPGLGRHLESALGPGSLDSLADCFEPLISYLGLKASSTRLYEVSDLMSGQFITYAQNRLRDREGTHIFAAWRHGLICDDPSGRRNEAWQRALYLLMFPKDRGMDLLAYAVHRSLVEGWRYGGSLDRVILFGSSFLSPLSFDFFHALSEDIEVLHFLLLPIDPESSRHEIETWTALSRTLTRHLSLRGIPIEWRPEAEGESHYPSPSATNAEQNDLSRLKSMIEGRDESAAASGDGSIRFHACSSKLREVETLRDSIVRIMAESRDSPSPLRLSDIAVMAPDIGAYESLIRAVFGGESPEIPFNMVDVRRNRGSDFMRAVEALLALPDGRFSRSEIFALLDNPCVQAAFGVDDSELRDFSAWVGAEDIAYGLSAAQRDEMGLGKSEENTWDRAFLRFSDGLFTMDAESESFPAAQSIGKFMAIVHELYFNVWTLKDRRMGLNSWTGSLRSVLENLVRATNEDEKRAGEDFFSMLGRLYQIAEDLGFADGASRDPMLARELDWPAFRKLVGEQIGQPEGSVGRQYLNGVVCSSLKPYRAIPFRVIALLGLNEDGFPRPDQRVSFDLLPYFPEQDNGFIGNRVQDRYAWLESIYAAKDALWVFYRGRDAQTGVRLLPSSLVSECAELFSDGSSSLFREEPIVPFDSSLFDNPHRSMTQYKRARAYLAGRGAVAPRPKAAPTASGDKAISARFEELSGFLRNPLRQFARGVIGLRLGGGDAADGDDEPLAQGFFPLRQMARKAVWKVLQDPEGREDAVTEFASELGEAERNIHPSPFLDFDRRRQISAVSEIESVLRSREGSPLRPLVPPREFQIDDGHGGLLIRGPEEDLWERAESDGSRRYYFTIVASQAVASGKSDDEVWAKIPSARALEAALARSLVEPAPCTLILCDYRARLVEVERLNVLAIPRGVDLDILARAFRDGIGRPLPFYADMLDQMTEAAREQGIQAVDLRAIWENFWAAPADFASNFMVRVGDNARNPVYCPYFPLLFDEIPAWRDEYDAYLRGVWIQPLLSAEEARL